MASFVVETYSSQADAGAFARAVDGAREAVEALRASGIQVSHVRSFLVPEDEMCFHVFEAVSVEDVARATELAGIEVERVVEAIGDGNEPPTDNRTEVVT